MTVGQLVSKITEKMVATMAVGAVAVILSTAVGVRWGLTGEVSGEMVTILATLAGVLLGVPVANGTARKINGS